MSDWLRELMQRVRAFFRREEMDREFDEEMATHLEMAIEEHIGRGMTPGEARRQALIRLGGAQQAKEHHREVRGLPVLDALLQDVSYGARMLGKSFSFTGVAVLALALGIGLSSIIFSIFYNGVLYPFPYRDAQRLTVIGIVDTAHNSERFREMYHLDEIREFRKLTHSFEDIVAYTGWDTVYSHDGISEPVHGCVLTPNGMEFWGVPPLLGRGISEPDARPGASPIVLLSYAFWKGHFRGDKSVLGATITLNKKHHTVIGIMPRRFGLYGADFYAPTNWNRPEAPPQEGGNYFFATALIKRNVGRRTAAADLDVVAHQLLATHQRDYPEHFAMTARPMNEVIVDDFRQTLFLLIAAVVLLLLISSSNVASLLLTHYTARSREITLRAALGASRARLIRQLLVESLLLSGIGCALGCFLAYLGLLVVRLVPGVSVPGEADLSLNLPVLVFAVLLSLVTTLFFGLSPAFLAVKRDLRTNLQTSGVNVNPASGGARIRAGLVVGQVALSMLLLVFAGLMIRSFLAVTNYDTGMRTQGVVSGFIQLPLHQYDSVASQRTLYERISSR